MDKMGNSIVRQSVDRIYIVYEKKEENSSRFFLSAGFFFLSFIAVQSYNNGTCVFLLYLVYHRFLVVIFLFLL